jgi:hypothetical protein
LVTGEIFDSARNANSFVHLFTGTVGSGKVWDSDGNQFESWNEPILRTRYGPFFGLPVLLSEECLEIAKTGGCDKKEPVLDQSPKAVSEGIVRLFDAGQKITKSEYKAILAPDISVRKFQSAWEMARDKRPEISTPGRKSSD